LGLQEQTTTHRQTILALSTLPIDLHYFRDAARLKEKAQQADGTTPSSIVPGLCLVLLIRNSFRRLSPSRKTCSQLAELYIYCTYALPRLLGHDSVLVWLPARISPSEYLFLLFLSEP
jgi:hypothetical protein